jgi:glycosyltransferase involved in cell wall biosynthesis
VRAARLRVGLTPGVIGLARGTGHGNAWVGLIDALRQSGRVKLVTRRADVWVASGHQHPPDVRPLVVQAFEAAWADPAIAQLLDPAFTQAIDTSTRAAVEAAAAVITTSHASRDQLLAAYGLPGDRVAVVPLGVDHQRFRPGLRGGRELAGGPYVLFVALLHPRKNFDAVRRAVADLARAGLPHRLVIVGRLPPDRAAQEFERRATAELDGAPDRVIRLRDLPDEQLAALMAGADVFCLPSLFEGFGLPVLEAMACGTPVVVSNAGALPEVVADGGLVVEPEPAAVSSAVRRVVTDPGLSERLRHAAFERAQSFSWERTAAGWVEVLSAVA